MNTIAMMIFSRPHAGQPNRPFGPCLCRPLLPCWTAAAPVLQGISCVVPTWRLSAHGTAGDAMAFARTGATPACPWWWTLKCLRRVWRDWLVAPTAAGRMQRWIGQVWRRSQHAAVTIAWLLLKCFAFALAPLVCTAWFATICGRALLRTALGERAYAIWCALRHTYSIGIDACVVVGVASLACTLSFAIALLEASLAAVFPTPCVRSLLALMRPACTSAIMWLCACTHVGGGTLFLHGRIAVAVAVIVAVLVGRHLAWGCCVASCALTLMVCSGFADWPLCGLLAILAMCYPSFPPKTIMRKAAAGFQQRRAVAKLAAQAQAPRGAPPQRSLAEIRFITLQNITLHYITLHYIPLQCITLHYITLHCITLHYITLPCQLACHALAL